MSALLLHVVMSVTTANVELILRPFINSTLAVDTRGHQQHMHNIVDGT